MWMGSCLFLVIQCGSGFRFRFIHYFRRHRVPHRVRGGADGHGNTVIERFLVVFVLFLLLDVFFLRIVVLLHFPPPGARGAGAGGTAQVVLVAVVRGGGGVVVLTGFVLVVLVMRVVVAVIIVVHVIVGAVAGFIVDNLHIDLDFFPTFLVKHHFFHDLGPRRSVVVPVLVVPEGSVWIAKMSGSGRF